MGSMKLRTILKNFLKIMMEIILNVIVKNQKKLCYIDLFQQVHLVDTKL